MGFVDSINSSSSDTDSSDDILLEYSEQNSEPEDTRINS